LSFQNIYIAENIPEEAGVQAACELEENCIGERVPAKLITEVTDQYPY